MKIQFLHKRMSIIDKAKADFQKFYQEIEEIYTSDVSLEARFNIMRSHFIDSTIEKSPFWVEYPSWECFPFRNIDREEGINDFLNHLRRIMSDNNISTDT